MKVGAPRAKHLPKFNIPKVAQPKDMSPHKPFKAQSHPHQDRLEQHRALPSLVTTNPDKAPKGK